MAASLVARAGRRAAWVLLGTALACGNVALAEALIDPTRPALGSPGAEVTAAPAPAPRLQMIVRGPGDTRRALIDGIPVRVGDTVRLPAGPARVEAITDASVLLARGPVRETLQLLPGLARAIQCRKGARGTQSADGC